MIVYRPLEITELGEGPQMNARASPGAADPPPGAGDTGGHTAGNPRKSAEESAAYPSIGSSVAGHFEEKTPKWRKLSKVAIFLGVTHRFLQQCQPTAVPRRR